MITITPALKAHFALGGGDGQTTCTLWLLKRVDGTTLGFTDLDKDLHYNLGSYLTSASLVIPEVTGTGTVTYAAATGYKRTDIAFPADLSPSNLELDGILNSPSMTEADLHAGLWDFAFYAIFMVNYADLSNTMGALILDVGNIGNVTLERDRFKAELRGRAQAYSRVLGELTQPGCRARLGDSRCLVDMTPFTVTGTIEGVNSDLVTLYDSARTEPGPLAAVNITGITNANPGVVTVVDGSTFSNGMAVTISGVVGPDLLNQSTFIRNLVGNTFQLGIDTSNTGTYPAYVSGGTVTPLGSDSGYFDFGILRMDSGLNAGLSMEIRSYVPGQFTLELPFPSVVNIGDAYTAKAGCDTSFATCKNRFNNVVHFRGEPDLPGLDKIVQIGKQG